MPRYPAILFDFDGVLADTERIHFECWRETLRPSGIELDWETYKQHCTGVDDKTMLRFLASLSSPPADFETLWGWYPQKRARYRHRVSQDGLFDAALVSFLKRLDTYALGVVSSSFREEVEPLLVRGGIRTLFQTLVCGQDVSRHKPHPEPYLLAAQQLGVTFALVVEDSVPGCRSARAAGFDVLRVAGPQDVPAKLARALAKQDCR